MTYNILTDDPAKRAAIVERIEAGVCMWFAACDNPATGTTPHPILGDVPTCDRCAERAA